MSGIRSIVPDLLASAELTVDSKGEGFTDTHQFVCWRMYLTARIR
jgi:hypothetical protein